MVHLISMSVLTSKRGTQIILGRFDISSDIPSNLQNSLCLTQSDYHVGILNLILYKCCLSLRDQVTNTERDIIREYALKDEIYLMKFARVLFKDIVPHKLAGYFGLPVTLVQLLHSKSFYLPKVEQSSLFDNINVLARKIYAN